MILRNLLRQPLGVFQYCAAMKRFDLIFQQKHQAVVSKQRVAFGEAPHNLP